MVTVTTKLWKGSPEYTATTDDGTIVGRAWCVSVPKNLFVLHVGDMRGMGRIVREEVAVKALMALYKTL